MKRVDVNRGSLKPFAQMNVIGRYFKAVKKMDKGALKGQDVDVDGILKLWKADGVLTLHGPSPIDDQKFHGSKDLASFYQRRTKGVDRGLSFNTSRVSVANAKGNDHLVVSGRRFVISEKGEGMEVPFTHKFTMNGSHIQELHIHVGTPTSTELAPQGSLDVEDMGRLAAMAWMVA